VQRNYDVDVQWMPFELNPSIGPKGWALPAAIRATMADPGNPLFKMAADVGLPPLKNRDVVPSSRLALEATEVARDHGKDGAFKKAVFHRYWALGQDISNVDVLCEAAAEVGVPQQAIRDAVTTRSKKVLVDQLIEQAHELGVDAVPTTVLAGKYALSGAQPYAVFERAMEQLGVPRRPSPA